MQKGTIISIAKSNSNENLEDNKRTVTPHYKECEFKFINRGKDLYKLLLKSSEKNL